MITRRSARLVATGAVAGLVSGLFGVAGGVIIVPALTSRRIGLAPATASGTSMAAVAPMAMVGMTAYTGLHSVAGGAAFGIIIGALAGAVAGSRIAPRVPGPTLRLAFCGLLVLTSLRMVAPLPNGGVTAGAVHGALGFASLITLGVVSGTVTGMLGSGGGTIMVPALVVGFGIPQQLAQGTALLAMIPMCAGGITQHHRQGTLSVRDASAVALGGALAVGGGAVLAAHTSPMALRHGLAAYLLVTAAVGFSEWRMARNSRTCHQLPNEFRCGDPVRQSDEFGAPAKFESEVRLARR